MPYIRTGFLVVITWFCNAIVNMMMHFSANDAITAVGGIATTLVSVYALYDIHLKVVWKKQKMKEEREDQERENAEHEAKMKELEAENK